MQVMKYQTRCFFFAFNSFTEFLRVLENISAPHRDRSNLISVLLSQNLYQLVKSTDPSKFVNCPHRSSTTPAAWSITRGVSKNEKQAAIKRNINSPPTRPLYFKSEAFNHDLDTRRVSPAGTIKNSNYSSIDTLLVPDLPRKTENTVRKFPGNRTVQILTNRTSMARRCGISERIKPRSCFFPLRRDNFRFS